MFVDIAYRIRNLCYLLFLNVVIDVTKDHMHGPPERMKLTGYGWRTTGSAPSGTRILRGP